MSLKILEGRCSFTKSDVYLSSLISQRLKCYMTLSIQNPLRLVLFEDMDLIKHDQLFLKKKMITTVSHFLIMQILTE